MPDITMCMNKQCKIKNTCYRYLAKPNDNWQSYTIFNPDEYECDNFLEYPEWQYLIIVLKKMCEIADIKFEDIDLKEKEWYTKHTWKPDQEQEFMEWFRNYLWNNNKARRNIMEIPLKDKKHIMLFVNFFNLSFGWKTELED